MCLSVCGVSDGFDLLSSRITTDLVLESAGKVNTILRLLETEGHLISCHCFCLGTRFHDSMSLLIPKLLR